MRVRQYQQLEQSVPSAWYAHDIDRVRQKQKLNSHYLTIATLSEHVGRFYLNGHNSFSSPWEVPIRPPEYLMPLIFLPEYESFRNELNSLLVYHPFWDYLSLLVTAIVLFCSSGTGIYGCLDAGMTGNATVLLSKSILDLFTAMVFACNLGAVTSLVAVPQLAIFLTLFFAAKAIYPLTTPAMIDDFKACGGFLLIATGCRIAKIQDFPVADMIPAMVLVMPLSALWVNWVIPML